MLCEFNLPSYVQINVKVDHVLNLILQINQSVVIVQVQERKCSWLRNPPLICAHGGDSSKAFPNTVGIHMSLVHSFFRFPRLINYSNSNCPFVCVCVWGGWGFSI